MPKENILEADISILKQHGKQEKILKNIGINTVGELINYSEADLLCIKGISYTTIEAINFQLKRYGLSLSKESQKVRYDKSTFEGKIYYSLISLIDKEIVLEKYEEFLENCRDLSLKVVPPLNESETCYLRKELGIETSSDLKWENDYKSIIFKLVVKFSPRKSRVIVLDKKAEQITGEELEKIIRCVNYSYMVCQTRQEFTNLQEFANRTLDEFASLFRFHLNDDLNAVLELYQSIKNYGCSFKDEEELINIYNYDETEREKDIEKAQFISISSLDLTNVIKNILIKNNYITMGDLLKDNVWRNGIGLTSIQVNTIINLIHNNDFCLFEETKREYIEISKLTIDDLELSVRLYNNLYRLELKNASQITSLNLKEIADFRTMRKKDVFNLYSIIHNLGLKFKDEDKYNLETIYKKGIAFEGAFKVKPKFSRNIKVETKDDEILNLQDEKMALLEECKLLNFYLEQEQEKIKIINDKLRKKLIELESKTSEKEFAEMKMAFSKGDSSE